MGIRGEAKSRGSRGRRLVVQLCNLFNRVSLKRPGPHLVTSIAGKERRNGLAL